MSLSPEAYILPILVVVFEWGSVIYSGMYVSIVFEAISIQIASNTIQIGNYYNSRVGFEAYYVVVGCVIFFSYLGLTILLTNGVRRGSVCALKGWVVTWGILWLLMIAFIIYFMTLGAIGKYALVIAALVRLGAIFVINHHKNEVAAASESVPEAHVIGNLEFYRGP